MLRSTETASGRISYAEEGTGPVALFVHGVLLNKHLWRYQLTGLSDIRRCIAVDLLAHGDTVIKPDQDVSVTANAAMLREVLDALKIDQVDLVGNDSGGGIAQIFAALHPDRVRTLTLTNCDTHDNWPPEAFKPFVEMTLAGGLRDTLNAMLADKAIYRSPQALGPAYEQPESVTDEDIETYFCGRWCAVINGRMTCSVSSRRSITITPSRSSPGCASCGHRPSSSGARTTSIFRSSGRTGWLRRYREPSRRSS